MLRQTTIAAAIALAASTVAQAEVTEAWRTTGFDTPESVSWDAANMMFYVSNIGGSPTEKDGNGFISRVAPDGTIVELKWVTGLDAPKGTEVAGNKLYVADIGQLVEIDVATGMITNRYPAEGGSFLNDIAVADDGRVFVAETFTSAIYVLEGGKLSTFVQDPKLRGPNGLTIVGGKLLVAELGDASKGFANLGPGNIKAIDLATKAITDFGPADLGNLDGIEPDGSGGVTVTDNPKGLILNVKAGGEQVQVGTVKSGAADHEFAGSLGLYVVPQMQDNAVVAYKPGS